MHKPHELTFFNVCTFLQLCKQAARCELLAIYQQQEKLNKKLFYQHLEDTMTELQPASSLGTEEFYEVYRAALQLDEPQDQNMASSMHQFYLSKAAMALEQATSWNKQSKAASVPYDDAGL